MPDMATDLGGATASGRLDAMRGDLAALYRSWRILDLVGTTVEAMPRDWLRILNVARTIMDGHSLPGVDLPDHLAKLVKPWAPEFETVLETTRRQRVVYPVAADSEVQPLREFGDLPLITMPDLLLRDMDRAMFEYRLLSGSINGVYPVDPGPTQLEYDEVRETRRPKGNPNRRRRQRVYALLDVSNSMRDADKILFAKGLLLAYLATAHEERAEVYFRTFANSVHPRSDCLAPDAFPALAQRVLQVAPDGSTDLKAAMAAAIGDISALDGVGQGRAAFQNSPTELLLISDCESYLVPPIPHGVKLHTVHLKGGPMMKGYAASFEQIRAASATFTEIDTTRFVLPESARDRWLLQQQGRLAGWQATETGGGMAPREADEKLRGLLTAYQRMSSPEKGTPVGRGVAGAHASGVPRLRLGDALRALWARLRRPTGAHHPEGNTRLVSGLQIRAKH